MVGHLKAFIICSINIHLTDFKDLIKQDKLKKLSSFVVAVVVTTLIAVTRSLTRGKLRMCCLG